ncbi:MAG TPA: type VI secretion system-associated FHA domain protein TagH [Povalibacter sp.]|nr:type VI secretion system-associated FHA domain protein TagH [Povalibacter sp.]
MILTLEVMGEQAAQLGAGRRKVFNAIGGTIGRLPDNDWVFPDPYVSGRHALIRYLNGRFFVEDTSTNGVFINSPDSRLSRTQAHPLKHGDVLYIDAYEIAVSIEKDAAADKDDANDPFAALKDRADRDRAEKNANANRAAAKAAERRDPSPVVEEEDRTASMGARAVKQEAAEESGTNATQWFGMSEMSLPEPEPAPRPRVPAPRPQQEAPQRAPARAPAVQRPAPKSPPPRAAARAPVADDDDEGQMQTLLDAAGVEGVDPSEDLARTCGEILRIVVNGLMEVLRAREQMKEELHIRSTTFKPANNNPLKFSANAEDAFHNLLVRQNAAYLEPTEAFDEALRDVRDHQTAVQAAIRLAFETMLAQFDPNRLQDEFDRQMKKGSILGVPAKLRYWDLYRDKYSEMIKDAESSFRALFGTEFAKAYEEHIERLKARSRNR